MWWEIIIATVGLYIFLWWLGTIKDKQEQQKVKQAE